MKKRISSLRVGLLLMGFVLMLGCTKERKTGMTVEMNTNLGMIEIELDNKSPITVQNFKDYVSSGFYNGTIFHRVIDGFVIQGGGFDKDMNQKQTKAPIQNEASNGVKNKVYSLSMARTNDPHSATTQFFVNLSDNQSLDYVAGSSDGYAVFGNVTKGQEIIQKNC